VVPRAVDLVSQLLAAPSTGEEENHQREPYHTVTKATFSPVELTVSALSGRGVSQGRLAHASRRHDQLGGRRRRAGAFAHLQQPYASPLPLVLVGLLAAVFLCIEARRYRFFDFWRIRAHFLEVNARDLKAEHHRVITRQRRLLNAPRKAGLLATVSANRIDQRIAKNGMTPPSAAPRGGAPLSGPPPNHVTQPRYGRRR
jgi:hypothetical protein